MKRLLIYVVPVLLALSCARPEPRVIDIPEVLNLTVKKEMVQPIDPITDYRETIRSGILKNLRSLKNCYSDLLKVEPSAKGKIVMSWLIRPDGSVIEVNIRETDQLNYPLFRGCLVNTLGQWKFPPREPPAAGSGQGPLESLVQYPFLFNP